MRALTKATALAVATVSLAGALPASAAPAFVPATSFVAPGQESYAHSRERYSRDDYRRGYGYRSSYRGEPVYRDTRVWRGDGGRYYCRRQNGTTGLLIGGAAGALLGRQIDQRGDRTLGTVLGAVGGALVGREIDRGDSYCR
ncbi:glycine zipper 2TM protein [Novosphingobium sp. PhB165]|uniref:glycine zipper 2TM domain-containing protein n=1 Tax=Novosphingobium sp. PhB165 TaxID=2485105 RepID=UPI00104EE4A4|nr:glycine zipper 2TM domain-containing protein [Novosphingobium sp. PhB165]TCM17307.1 glycine zipper 2TM protein [Novosphingobium sp. PhB165]